MNLKKLTTRKFIYWNDQDRDKHGNQYACVHLLVGYCGETLKAFQELGREIRKTFPQAKLGSIKCGRINHSDTYHGFSIVSWEAFLPKKKYRGWVNRTAGSAGYRW